MDYLVAKNQLAFIRGWHLTDGVVAVNEVLNYKKKVGRDCLIFKVNFDKAYDSVD